MQPGYRIIFHEVFSIEESPQTDAAQRDQANYIYYQFKRWLLTKLTPEEYQFIMSNLKYGTESKYKDYRPLTILSQYVQDAHIRFEIDGVRFNLANKDKKKDYAGEEWSTIGNEISIAVLEHKDIITIGDLLYILDKKGSTIHEIIHLLDDIKTGGKTIPKQTRPRGNEEEIIAYMNSPEEINAFTQTIIDTINDDLNEQKFSKEMIAQMKRNNNDIVNILHGYITGPGAEFDYIWRRLNDKNKRRVVNRVIGYIQEIFESSKPFVVNHYRNLREMTREEASVTVNAHFRQRARALLESIMKKDLI